jgi:hypothetical protein
VRRKDNWYRTDGTATKAKVAAPAHPSVEPASLPRWGDDPRKTAAFNRTVSGVIDYLCTSEAHQILEDAPNPVVACDGGRGYCPAGAAEGHDWRATGGRTLATVREWMGRLVTVG